jgi:hypothetical protein
MLSQKLVTASPLGNLIIGSIIYQINREALIVAVQPLEIEPLGDFDFFNHH